MSFKKQKNGENVRKSQQTAAWQMNENTFKLNLWQDEMKLFQLLRSLTGCEATDQTVNMFSSFCLQVFLVLILDDGKNL